MFESMHSSAFESSYVLNGQGAGLWRNNHKSEKLPTSMSVKEKRPMFGMKHISLLIIDRSPEIDEYFPKGIRAEVVSMDTSNDKHLYSWSTYTDIPLSDRQYGLCRLDSRKSA